MFLENIKSPADLKKINKSDYPALCGEIRSALVENIMKTGGHLASNLGVVELTLAYHLVFDCPKDKIVFDVGHQSYVHKMLTGRYEKFSTIRQAGGISGFPKPSESDCDAFVAGHASTSVSAALGIARARDILGEDYSVCAFIGDGALGGGMVYEAMSDAGTSKTNLIIILNDNEMSIEKNVGGMSEYLSRLRTAKKYLRTKDNINNLLSKMGRVGDAARHTISTFKDAFKYSAIAGGIFENLGFTYIGIIDGHNINSLVKVFKRAKELDGPVLIHTFTKKGMGYENAENDPEAFHGVSRKATVITKNAINYSSAAGEILNGLAMGNPKVTALTAAMATGCGLCGFAKKFPERFFDVGIAEQHMVTTAAGMAAGGLIPVAAVYSTFLQRAYDQLIHDVCLPNLHVVFLVDRAGIVGEDGETHQGVFDLSYLSHMPNMKIFAPSCYKELEQMMNFAVNKCSGPVAIRYPRGAISLDNSCPDFKEGASCVVSDGDDAAIFAVGRMNKIAKGAVKILNENGISAAHINVRSIKPFDRALFEKYSKKCRAVFTLEDNLVNGGFGSFVKVNTDIENIFCIGWGDMFIPQGKPGELFEKYGLDKTGVAQRIEKELKNIKD